MKTYIALLRGINVGGHKKILMADLRSLFVSLGFTEVRTYIQSGNIVFRTSEKERGLEGKITEAIELKYGFKVLVLVKKASEIAKIVSKCPFSEEKREKSFFVLLGESPSEENIEITAAISYTGEEFHITRNCVYLYCSISYHKAKMSNNFFEKKLKVTATTRNYRTMAKLLEIAIS